MFVLRIEGLWTAAMISTVNSDGFYTGSLKLQLNFAHCKNSGFCCYFLVLLCFSDGRPFKLVMIRAIRGRDVGDDSTR